MFTLVLSLRILLKTLFVCEKKQLFAGTRGSTMHSEAMPPAVALDLRA
ncbi:MAG: hypothetical protein WA628_24330 [Terriglobales bacterium]